MLKSATGDSAGFVTTRLSFLDSEVVGKTRYLFAIGEGVPIVEALDQASCILYAAHLSNAYLNEAEDNNLKVRQALCLQLELARALVESVIEALKG
ncbi:MAG: DUF3077 domain-containing protein [Rhodocyclaceae bacterium]|nr:DUF3077 domain-containing protein [Rhodocyclaceae bacterium]